MSYVLIAVRLPKYQYDAVKNEAAAREMTVSDIIREKLGNMPFEDLRK